LAIANVPLAGGERKWARFKSLGSVPLFDHVQKMVSVSHFEGKWARYLSMVIFSFHEEFAAGVDNFGGKQSFQGTRKR